jgi:hypothetical protein
MPEGSWGGVPVCTNLRIGVEVIGTHDSCALGRLVAPRATAPTPTPMLVSQAHTQRQDFI